MENDFEVRTALLAFQKIVQHGKKLPQGQHELDGIEVESDFDGYNLTMITSKVKLMIFFHSTFKFEYDSVKDLDLFVKDIQRISQLD